MLPFCKDRLRVALELAGGQPVGIRLSGKCMEPLISDGFRVEIRTARTYFPGDVVLVLPSGADFPYLHRLLGAYWRGGMLRYITQGDNSVAPDHFVHKSQLLGKVCGGDGSKLLAHPSLRHRIYALWRFFVFIIKGFFRN